MKAPFPWFGGKRKVAPQVWAALGDVDNYVEPFAGSLAVLLERPAWHTGSVETINDADQYVANFWRALAHDPDGVAYYADWPVNEADLFSRHLWLVNEGKRQMIEGMEDDPDWYDVRIAGWWVWGISAWIGSGWCSGDGPHTYASLAANREAGKGINRVSNGAGVSRRRPHLSRGRGVNRKRLHQSRTGQGVNRKRPHLGNKGRGVARKLPFVDNGQGVNRQRPHLSGRGQGVHRAQGVAEQSPDIAASASLLRMLPANEGLYAYMRELAARLRYVRVCCGDWSRVVTKGALSHGSTIGVFLDPPYSDKANRSDKLYAVDDLNVAHDVRAWALSNGDNPRYRIVLAGYSDEHDAEMPSSWRRYAWTARKAYCTSTSAGSTNDVNRRKEMLWFSPHCLNPQSDLLEVAP